jgi:hypothetical protein
MNYVSRKGAKASKKPWRAENKKMGDKEFEMNDIN